MTMKFVPELKCFECIEMLAKQFYELTVSYANTAEYLMNSNVFPCSNGLPNCDKCGLKLYFVTWIGREIERQQFRCSIFDCRKRDAITLATILPREVEIRSTIYSDQWRGYIDVSEYGYYHDTVNSSN